MSRTGRRLALQPVISHILRDEYFAGRWVPRSGPIGRSARALPVPEAGRTRADASSAWPPAVADLPAGDGDGGRRAVLVAPDRVTPGRQAGVDGRVPGLAGHVTRPDLRVRAPGAGLVVAADLDFLAVHLGRR